MSTDEISVSVASRRILKLYNVGEARIMTSEEEEDLESVFHVVIEKNLQKINHSIFLTKVDVDSQSFLFGESEHQIEMVLTIYAQYKPPPEINFARMLMEELNSNLPLYRNRLKLIPSDYFKPLRRVEVTGYYNHLPSRIPPTTEEELKMLESEISDQRQEMLRMKENYYHYQLDTEQMKEQSVRDVAVAIAYTGGANVARTNNYKTTYQVQDSSSTTTQHLTFVALALTLVSLLILAVIGTIYNHHRHKRQRTDTGHTNGPKKVRFPRFNLVQLLQPGEYYEDMENNTVRFEGVTDFDLKDAKDISFRGVMDYENKPRHHSYSNGSRSNNGRARHILV